MLDIDHFKKINDRWGHLIGDQILRQLSDLVVQKVRGTDLVARYGGEEFAVILPDTDKTGAYRVGEKLRRTVEQQTWTLSNQELLPRMTISLGVGTYPLDARDMDTLIEKTDQALYRAKRGGRNQVVEA
jgi:diguanylate cyclase (GGDEF)-like protein